MAIFLAADSLTLVPGVTIKSDKSSAYVMPKLFSMEVFNSLILSDILFATSSPAL